MTIYQPYTYLIGWSKLNKFYYGVKYSKGCKPSDLWVKYYTSSKHVKEMRTIYGEPDIIQIRKLFVDSMSARIWENKVLRRLKVKKSNKWLNLTDNMSMPSPSDLPILVEKTRREKISQSHKLNPRYGMLGKTHSETSKKIMSNIKKTYWDTIDYDHKIILSSNMKQGQKNMSAEMKEKQKLNWQKAYYDKDSLTCPYCSKVSKNRGAMARHHFDYCKLKPF